MHSYDNLTHSVSSYFPDLEPFFLLSWDYSLKKLLDTSNNSIDTINECLEENICPTGSRCINTIGSYTCTCDVGYFLMTTDNGGNTCNGKKLSFQ